MSRAHILLFSLWGLLTLPAIYLAWAYSTDFLTYGQTLSLSGDIAVKLLIAAMAITPLRLAFPKSSVIRPLMKYRRAIGVASFGYAGFHLWVYIVKKADFDKITSEGLRLEILTGWVAFFIFIPLALTSNQQSVRKLGQTWKRLHRWIYAAAILILLHWVLTAFDPVSAYFHAGVLAALEIYRVWKQKTA